LARHHCSQPPPPCADAAVSPAIRLMRLAIRNARTILPSRDIPFVLQRASTQEGKRTLFLARRLEAASEYQTRLRLLTSNSVSARKRNSHLIGALPHGRTVMKRFVFPIVLSSLMFAAVCGTAQAAYYHHRHHHYWHHGHPTASIGTTIVLTGRDEVITRSPPDNYP
jgi:hypothetical protein